MSVSVFRVSLIDGERKDGDWHTLWGIEMDAAKLSKINVLVYEKSYCTYSISLKVALAPKRMNIQAVQSRQQS
jgi:hypothetical protein